MRSAGEHTHYSTRHAAEEVPCSVRQFMRIAKVLGLQEQTFSSGRRFMWNAADIERVRGEIEARKKGR